MNQKPFKTYNQMLKILRKRNLIIEDGSKAKRILERENYYCVINGYKDLFIDKNESEEKYLSGTTFDEVFSLFSLDRRLKELLLPEIIKAESYMKSLVSYYFQEKFPEPNSYLVFENYTDNTSLAKDVLMVISSLSNVLSRQHHNAVTYYISHYYHCPLWVLVNFMTFGNISKFYKVNDKDVRLNLAKHLSKEFEREYQLNSIRISEEMIDECIGAFVVFRNTCAHDERLYNCSARFKDRALSRLLQTNSLRQHGLFSVLILLKLFLKKKDYIALLKKYNATINEFSPKFKTIRIDEIKNIIGHDDIWLNKHLT